MSNIAAIDAHDAVDCARQT